MATAKRLRLTELFFAAPALRRRYHASAWHTCSRISVATGWQSQRRIAVAAYFFASIAPSCIGTTRALDASFRPTLGPAPKAHAI